MASSAKKRELHRFPLRRERGLFPIERLVGDSLGDVTFRLRHAEVHEQLVAFRERSFQQVLVLQNEGIRATKPLVVIAPPYSEPKTHGRIAVKNRVDHPA